MSKKLVISKELKDLDKQLCETLGLTTSPVEQLHKHGSQIIAVRNFLASPEAMGHIKAIMDTDNGFLTDSASRSTPYTDKEISDCVANALVAGLDLVGNHFNIIGGNMMIVQNGYMHLCRHFENDELQVSNMQVITGELKPENGIMKIPMTIQYDCFYKNGGDYADNIKFERIVQLSMKSHETVDAWIGKAKRRIMKDFHEYLCGKSHNDDITTNPESIRPDASKEVKAEYTTEKPNKGKL